MFVISETPCRDKLIVEEKKMLMAEIEKSQDDMSQYHEMQQKCAEQKAELEIALTEAQNKLVRTIYHPSDN